MAVQKYYNGTTWVEVNGLAPNIIGSADPTTSTIGYVGQLYTNSTTNVMFQCTEISDSTYIWSLIDGAKLFHIDIATTTQGEIYAALQSNMRLALVAYTESPSGLSGSSSRYDVYTYIGNSSNASSYSWYYFSNGKVVYQCELTQQLSSLPNYTIIQNNEKKGYLTINGTSYQLLITSTDPGEGTAGQIIIVTGS